jgi:heme/copper-type cytochrome/quinol oxidase subunit 2
MKRIGLALHIHSIAKIEPQSNGWIIIVIIIVIIVGVAVFLYYCFRKKRNENPVYEKGETQLKN